MVTYSAKSGIKIISYLELCYNAYIYIKFGNILNIQVTYQKNGQKRLNQNCPKLSEMVRKYVFGIQNKNLNKSFNIFVKKTNWKANKIRLKGISQKKLPTLKANNKKELGENSFFMPKY